MTPANPLPSSGQDAGLREALTEQIAAYGYGGGYEWYRNKWIGDQEEMIADLVANFVPRALASPQPPRDEMREALEKLCTAITVARDMVPDEDEGLAADVFAKCLNFAQMEAQRVLSIPSQGGEHGKG